MKDTGIVELPNESTLSGESKYASPIIAGGRFELKLQQDVRREEKTFQRHQIHGNQANG